jgi:murein L,D-transpeptidase YcbB/YkuD
VRVEQILPLASYVLTAGPEAMAQIKDIVAQGQTRTLPLSRKMPVYMLYWTAFADADGQVRYAKDIYGRDRRMIAAMHRQPLRVAAVEPPCRKA